MCENVSRFFDTLEHNVHYLCPDLVICLLVTVPISLNCETVLAEHCAASFQITAIVSLPACPCSHSSQVSV